MKNTTTTIIGTWVARHMAAQSQAAQAGITRDITTGISSGQREAIMELSGASISSAGVTLGFKVGKVVIETTPITAQFAALTACARLTDKLSKNLGVKVPPIQCPVMPGFKLRA